MTVLYDVIFMLFAVAYLPYLLFTGRYHKDFKQRLGVLPQDLLNVLDGKDIIWVHAVSVGEVMATRSFSEGLLEKYPSKKLVISTVTKTGNDVAKRLFGNKVTVIYLPLDISWIVNKVLNKLKPKLFVMVETEIWPNLLNALAKRKTPVVMINGRISPKSFKRYMLIKPFIKGILKKITLFCMQNNDYAKKIEAMGAPREKVRVTGNMKFDAASGMLEQANQDILMNEIGLKSNESVFIAGSTHPGEDEIIIEVYKKLLDFFPSLKLIIAPRHIERTPDIENLAKKLGFTPIRLSKINRDREPISDNNNILILDTMGRLSQFYSIATLVFIGGSLIQKGGQNIVEPAVLGKSIMFGPNMYNFSDITNSFLNKSAACMVKDSVELLEVSKNILNNSEKRRELGRRAKEVVRNNLGASQRNLEKLEELL